MNLVPALRVRGLLRERSHQLVLYVQAVVLQNCIDRPSVVFRISLQVLHLLLESCRCSGSFPHFAPELCFLRLRSGVFRLLRQFGILLAKLRYRCRE